MDYDDHNYADTTYVPASGEIDILDWEIFADTNDSTGLRKILMDGCLAQVNATIRSQFENDPPQVYLPYQWGPESDGGHGPAVTDPAMLYVVVPLGKDDDSSPCYKISLESVIKYAIEIHMNYADKVVSDPDGVRICTAIAARLRELADGLDKACKPETT